MFVAQLEDAYQTGVWQGIVDQAQARGAAVTCFVGPGDGSPEGPGPQGSVAFQIASPQAFDGLIVLSNTIGTLPNPGKASLPQVSLGWKLPRVPSVAVDGTQALWTLVRHLVRDHGRRSFALITGPEGHGESRDREAAIRRALEVEGLGIDDELVFRGTFYNASGVEGVRHLLAAHRPFDVIMALNDRMAIGALEALKDAGLRVPEQVSVTGFDNIDQGRHVTPTLTTVDQPLRTMGSLAVDMILDVLDGRHPPDRVLSCEAVLRWSCGCPPRGREFVSTKPEAPWDEETVARLSRTLGRNDEPEFLVGLARALETHAGGQGDGIGLVDALEARAFPGSGDPHPLADAGRRLASEVRVRAQASRLHGAVDRFAAVRGLSARIAGAFGREALFQRLQEGWQAIGIRRGLLVLFESPTGPGLPPFSRVALPDASHPFPTRDLLPSAWGRPWTQGRWVLEPLVYQAEPLGYLLLEATAEDLGVYGALRDQVASTLKGTLLMEALRDHERSLEAEVDRRTRDLTLANEELLQEVRRRRDLEHQVQEISDQTMRRIGQDLHDDLCQHLAGVAMLATVVRRNLPEAAADAGPSLDRIGALLQDSIIRARQIARGLYPPGLEERGLADAIEELVVTARATSSALIFFETEGDCRGGSPDRRLQMFRIVQEALANALKHSGSDVVRVQLSRKSGSITASVTDFGPGLTSEAPNEGLGLGIMKHRAEAAGLELGFEPLEPGLRVVCRWPEEESRA